VGGLRASRPTIVACWSVATDTKVGDYASYQLRALGTSAAKSPDSEQRLAVEMQLRVIMKDLKLCVRESDHMTMAWKRVSALAFYLSWADGP
jgi:hypothetical protein